MKFPFGFEWMVICLTIVKALGRHDRPVLKAEMVKISDRTGTIDGHKLHFLDNLN